jgi:fatty acid desaturase
VKVSHARGASGFTKVAEDPKQLHKFVKREPFTLEDKFSVTWRFLIWVCLLVASGLILKGIWQVDALTIAVIWAVTILTTFSGALGWFLVGLAKR